MYGIQYLFDGGLRKFMFRQLEVVRLTWCLFEWKILYGILEKAKQRTVVINIHVG